MMRALASLALSLTLALLTASTAVDAQGRTRNVVLIVTDGLRWQEVFTGAERALISSKPGGVRDTASLRRDFWRDTPEARREALLPFLWGTVARQGQLIGNRERGSDAHVTNTMRFSYPGYNELFTGAFDPRIDSNGYPANPNETVFEWIATRPGFEGKVGALATWDVFRNILNRDRAGIPVLDGWDPPFAAVRAPTPRMQFVDELYRTSVQLWNGNAFDAPMHLAAKEFVRANSPRLLFVGYGETDEWAHSGMYDMVLRSAHQVDAFIADLWTTMQAMPQYRDRTTFIITTDHGRGSGAEGWRDHGQDVSGAEHIWMAVIGPDTPALGERNGIAPVTQSQVAATVAALLGEDWNARSPRAGRPLADVFGTAARR
ncbi:MAG: alkaline phosphatase family protein [Gemmatimonadaceae bacterium]|nr:alkaline phosphatase family protein [Gemmatimonadaceae bacterium]